jgi:hypothetical protein
MLLLLVVVVVLLLLLLQQLKLLGWLLRVLLPLHGLLLLHCKCWLPVVHDLMPLLWTGGPLCLLSLLLLLLPCSRWWRC